MVEVIDLLTSPLKSPQLPARAAISKSISSAADIFNFNSDDFEFTGLSEDLEFPASNPTKRQKLSNEAITKRTTSKALGKAIQFHSDDFKFDLPDFSSPLNPPKRIKSGEAIEAVQVSDPITFSSSAPDLRTSKKISKRVYDLSDELPENVFGDYVPSLSQPTTGPSSRVPLSEMATKPFATLRNALPTAGTKWPPPAQTSRFRKKGASIVAAAVIDEIFSSPSKTQYAKERKSQLTEAEKTARAAERAGARANAKVAKDAEKETEKERKRQEKEEKAREKQKANDIAEVNKKKTDKKVSSAEMLLDMSRAFEGTSTGNQVEEYMKLLEVETTFFEETDLSRANRSEVLSLGNIIRWRRKVNAQYNDELGHWVPLAGSRIDHESHIMILLTAAEFATIAAHPASQRTKTAIDEDAMKANLDRHIKYIQSQAKVPNSKVIYLIEGLTAWLKKNKNARNRAYQAAVLSQDPEALSSSQLCRPKKRKIPTPNLDISHIDETLAQSLQLHLQLHPSRPKIHLTTSPTTTAAWVKTFTEHISTIPYRTERLSNNLSGASFCMESGQIRTGDNPMDTYVKMLQEVQRVTPSMAYGIANEWGSVRELVEGFRREGQGMLEDVRKSANKDGGISDRRLGVSVSKRLWKVFMGRDPVSTDGIA